MANIDANLNDIEAWGGESTKLPPDEYQFKIIAADVESKEDGEKVKNQLVIDYEVVSGAFAGKTCKAWFQLDFTKDAPRKRLKSLVLAANIPLSPNGGFETTQLIGCKLNADVTHETYEGKPDPILGGKGPERVAVRVVNERTFREIGAKAAQGVPSVSGKSAGIGGNLPGLTKA